MIAVYLLISHRYLGNDVTAEMSFEIAPESPNKFAKKENPPHNTSLEKEISVLTLFFNENFKNEKNLDDFYKKHKSSIRDIIITMKERLQLNREDFEKEVDSLGDSKYLYEKTLIEIFRIDTSVDIKLQKIYCGQMPSDIVGYIVKMGLVDEFEKMTCTAQKEMCERNMMNAKTPFYDCKQEPLKSIHKRTCQEEVITNHRFIFLNDQQFRRFKNLFLKEKPFEYVQKLTIRNGISDDDPLFSFVLPNLTVLDVSNNGLDILSDEIVNFKNLTELKLSSNQLETLPGNLAELPNLTHLDLSYNPLSKDALKVVFNIASLTSLGLNHCSINEHEADETEKIKLDFLEFLDLSENELEIVPSWIFNLSSLKTLHMYSNQFEELPDNIASLDNLTLLNVAHNKIGQLPECIASLDNLTLLNVSHNDLDESIQSINLPDTLTELDLANNEDMEKLPQNIKYLTNLKKIDITNINLSEFPENITRLTNLTHLDLSNNPLSKDSLKVVFNLASLTTLDLCNFLNNEDEADEAGEENNESNEENIELDVEIDEENIKLEFLNISENKLKNVPSWICKFSNLKTLHMHNNQFKKLPNNINSLVNLKELDVSHNALDDSIQYINLPVTLTALYLGNNDEMKNLPQNIECLTNLKKLDITKINLSEFPENITRLTNLTELNVSNNYLRQLPVEINKLTNLTYLNLSGNDRRIYKYVPDSFSQKKKFDNIL